MTNGKEVMTSERSRSDPSIDYERQKLGRGHLKNKQRRRPIEAYKPYMTRLDFGGRSPDRPRLTVPIENKTKGIQPLSL